MKNFIGLKIKELRESKNMTQDELADKLGVSKQMISLYETGVNEPRKAKLEKIAEICKADISYFYTNLTKTSNEQVSSQSATDLKEELIRLHRAMEEILLKSNADKDKIIELQQTIDKLKDKYERKQG
jgi:transcriptional regulator with XRE-family HTH domain